MIQTLTEKKLKKLTSNIEGQLDKESEGKNIAVFNWNITEN